MKIVINILIIMIASIATSNAQFFVEGSVGARFSGQSSSLDGVTKNNPSSYHFEVSPLVGYHLNEKLVLGVSAFFIRSTERFIITDPDTGDEILLERKSPGWGGSVFDRYQLWGTKKFSLLVESSIFVNESYSSETRGSKVIKNENRSSIGINAFPLISYDLSDRFSITLSTDFMRLDLYTQTINNKDTGVKTKSPHFEFNGQSTILSSLSAIRIGIIYHFKKSDK